MKMIYIDDDGNARLTGVGAEFETDQATTAAFESVRPASLRIKNPRARFILDLCEDDGEIVDSLAISVEAFEAVSGEPFRGNQHYVDYDIAENERTRFSAVSCSQNESMKNRTSSTRMPSPGQMKSEKSK